MKNGGILQAPLVKDKKPRRVRCGRSCCVFFCLFLCLLLVIFFLAVGIAALIIWLVLHPHSPQFTLESAQIPTLQVIQPATQNQASAAATVNADVILSVQTTNPNRKISIYYEVITVYISISGTQIGKTQVPAFFAGHQNITLLVAEVKAQSVPVQSSVSTLLQSQISQNHISLQARVDVKAKLKIGRYESFSFWVHTRCTLVVTPPSGNITGHLQSHSCHMVL